MNPVQFFSQPWLNGATWVALLALPLAIVLLYFLKLKRQPLEVPSTFLWTQAIEDLRVNTIWQRLRQNLLLFLQLLLVALAILACLQPGWRSSQLVGDRFIFVLDASASMQATDVAPTRLESAKQTALGYIDEMKSGDVAMVISFSETARVEREFTDNRTRLRTAIKNIRQTNRPTDLSEALRAAVGLAAPGRSAFEAGDVQVAQAKPATMYIFSDGGFPQVDSFTGLLEFAENQDGAFREQPPLRGLRPVFIAIGDVVTPDNVAVAAFTTEQNPLDEDQTQAFAQFENHGVAEVVVDAELTRDGTFLDAARVRVPAKREGMAGNVASVTFSLGSMNEGVLKIDIKAADSLSIDDIAYAALNPSRRSKILVVTAFQGEAPANQALVIAMKTSAIERLAIIDYADTAILQDPQHQQLAAAGAYDLIIYDQVRPTEMPQANTLFFGRAPPAGGWSLTPVTDDRAPVVIDTDKLHPLTRLLNLNNVVILNSAIVVAPQGATELITGNIGSLFAISPRQGFEDAVLGFGMLATEDQGGSWNTQWWRDRSFPVFVYNVVRYLGGSLGTLSTPSYQPGTPVLIRTEGTIETVRVVKPDRTSTDLNRDGQATFVFDDANQQGVYQVYEKGQSRPLQQFSVNLFDAMESDLLVRDLNINDTTVKATAGLVPIRRDLWKWLVLLALGLLAFEWYVYNRRVYI
ncbi:MAG: BatA and WFA domain-containing protein [Planctomycetota bacterium]|nr:BatA and WFA domain-containing protein [Planctomycetota bacterium]